MNQLVNTNAVPAKVRDEVLNQFQAAEATFKAAQAKEKTGAAMIAEAKSKFLAAEADQRAAKAKLEVAVAARDLAKVLLDYTEVRAPFAGEISLRSVDRGTWCRVHLAALPSRCSRLSKPTNSASASMCQKWSQATLPRAIRSQFVFRPSVIKP